MDDYFTSASTFPVPRRAPESHSYVAIKTQIHSSHQANRIGPRCVVITVGGKMQISKVLKSAVTLILSAAISACFAGHYEVTYSGGTVAYLDDMYDYYEDDYHQSNGSYIGNQSERQMVECSGELVAKFTWIPLFPGEPTPKCVIVKETASATVYCAVAGSASCTTSIPNETGSLTTGTTIFGTKNGTRYSIKNNPPATFTVSCSPQASSSTWILNGATASVEYTAVYADVSMSLSGGIGSIVNKQYLIGQLGTGSVSIPFNLVPSSYAWTVSGGEPFGSWVASRTFAGPPSPVDTNDPTVNFHFKVPDAGASVAVAVHVNVPAGSAPSSGLNINLTTPVTVLAPDSRSLSAYTRQNAGSLASPPYTVGGINYAYPSTGVGNYFQPSPTGLAFLGVYSPKYPNSTVGIRWDAMIDTYTGPGTNPWGSDGGWHFVQKAVPHREMVKGGITYYMSLNDQDLLDTTYPYEPGPYDPDSGSPGTAPANGVSDHWGDAPSNGLDSAATEVSANDSFETWLMYRPPGSGSNFVPIRKLVWFWAGHSYVSGGAWGIHSENSGWSFSGSEYPAFPQWTAVATSAGLAIWNP